MLLNRDQTRTKVEGIARTGEISPKGWVSHTEDWDGRIMAKAAPNVLRLVMDRDGHVRPMTMREMIDRGYFIVAKGPIGVRREGLR